MRGLGIECRTGGAEVEDRGAHRAVERRGCKAVHLPESAGVDAEIAVADALGDHFPRLAGAGLRGIRAGDHTHPAVGGLDEVDPSRPCARASCSAACSTSAVASG